MAPWETDLIFDSTAHPPIVHPPDTPQEFFYQSGASGQGMGPSQTPRAGQPSPLDVHAHTSMQRSMPPAPVPSLPAVAVLCWLEGDTGVAAHTFCQANTTCQEGRG